MWWWFCGSQDVSRHNIEPHSKPSPLVKSLLCTYIYIYLSFLVVCLFMFVLLCICWFCCLTSSLHSLRCLDCTAIEFLYVFNQSYRIHTWFIYLHFVDLYGQCRYVNIPCTDPIGVYCSIDSVDISLLHLPYIGSFGCKSGVMWRWFKKKWCVGSWDTLSHPLKQFHMMNTQNSPGCLSSKVLNKILSC